MRLPATPIAAFSLVGLLLLSACGNDGEPLAAAPQPPSGVWYPGDFHVHTSLASNDTRYPDGSLRSFPETIREIAQQRGMAFVTLTDHSNSAGSIVHTTVEDGRQWNQGPEFPLWDMAAELSTPSFLMVDASELSPVSTLDPRICEHCPTVGTGELTPVGHVGCVPNDLATFDLGGAFVDRPPGAVPGGSSVEQCQARGGFAIVNHPFYKVTPWIEYDWTSFAYDAIEVWNGSAGYSAFDKSAYDAYLCDRLAGRAVVAVGGSDNHRTPLPYEDEVSVDAGAPLGLPMTSVFAERLEWSAIMRAVRHGRIVIHERGTFVDLQIHAENGAWRAGVGDTIGAQTARVTLRGSSPRAQTVDLRHIAPGGCNERRQPGRDAVPRVVLNVVHSRPVCSAGPCDFDEQVTLALQPGLYFATVGDFATVGLNVRDVAITNVITVR
jgi:hypothetical protein